MPTMKTFEGKWMLIPLVMALLLSACSADGDRNEHARSRSEPRDAACVGHRGAGGHRAGGGCGRGGSVAADVGVVRGPHGEQHVRGAEELAATVEAIEAAMTADQLAAIEAMDVSGSEIEAQAPSGSAPEPHQRRAARRKRSHAAAMDPAMEGEMGVGAAGGMPMDGGRPAGRRSRAADLRRGRELDKSPTRRRAACPDVIELLQSKTQLELGYTSVTAVPGARSVPGPGASMRLHNFYTSGLRDLDAPFLYSLWSGVFDQSAGERKGSA